MGMYATEKVIIDLNEAKHILCHPQMLTPEMCIKIGQVITSAIALLKEREPKPVKITRNAYDHKFYHCPNCDHDFYDFYKKPNFCEKCGQAVKWDA